MQQGLCHSRRDVTAVVTGSPTDDSNLVHF